MNTYRFIRFVKEPVQRRGRLEDVVKVFFDIDDYPQNFFTEEEFMEFLESSELIEKGTRLWREIKDNLRVYGIHYVLDTKKGQLIHYGLEAAPEEQPSLKAAMNEMLETGGYLHNGGSHPRRRRKKDIHDYLKTNLPTIERIGQHAIH